MSDTPVKSRDASTVLLIRDGCGGLEVFMVVRHPDIEFAAGALVFPGGAVDVCDRGETSHGVVAQHSATLEPRELAWRVAAIREVYEECGVLLAREHGATTRIDAKRLTRIDARYHQELRDHSVDIVALALAESIELDCDGLIPFGHWVTPISRPKRFDTRFYVAGAPADQVARHDGHESVHSLWGNPSTICAEADEGKWHLRFPTRMSLEKLAASHSVAEALSDARNGSVVKILSEAKTVPEGNRVRIPREAGYGITEAIIDDDGKIVSRK